MQIVMRKRIALDTHRMRWVEHSQLDIRACAQSSNESGYELTLIINDVPHECRLSVLETVHEREVDGELTELVDFESKNANVEGITRLE